MGISYGIRGGDVADINQINGFLTRIEKMSNINIVLNTVFFENNVDRQINSQFFIGQDKYLVVASVYIRPASLAAPTVYPATPVCFDLTNNTSLTETVLESKTDTFTCEIDYRDYKIHIMRKAIMLNTTNIYITCQNAPIGSVKDLQHSGLSQFLIWTEDSRNATFTRLQDGILSDYQNFNLSPSEFSSFSMCLIDESNDIYKQQLPDGAFLTPLSSFFLCDNWTERYLTDVRLLFKNIATGINTFCVMELDQRNPNTQSQDYIEIDLDVENSYTNYTEYSFNDSGDIMKIIKSLKKDIGDNVITIVMRNDDGAGVITDYFVRCVKVKNENYKMMTVASNYPLSPASLFPLRQNSRNPHNDAYFSGNIGVGEKPISNSNQDNKYRISFENGLVDVFTNQFSYNFYNTYSILFGVGK